MKQSGPHSRKKGPGRYHREGNGKRTMEHLSGFPGAKLLRKYFTKTATVRNP